MYVRIRWAAAACIGWCGFLQAQSIPQECLQRTAEDFGPMTTTERLAEAELSVTGPTAFLYTAAWAGVNQAANRPKEWRQSAVGFGWRAGSAYGEYFISQTVEQLVAFGLYEDNRYFASGRRGLPRRMAYAISSTFLARHDNGSRSVSLSGIAGPAAAAFVATAWQPRSTTSPADAAVSFGIAMGIRSGLNLLREFAPRWARRLR